MNVKRQVILAGLVTGALVLSACGSDSDVEVEGAWARTSPMAVTLGAAYFDLTVAEDDRLVGATVSSDIAARAEIHEVVASDMEMSEEMSGDMEMSEEMSGDMDDADTEEGSHDLDDMEGMEGMMTMREVDGGLTLTGGETVTFEPGGYHVMLIDLVDPLEVGEEFDITLDFESAEDTTFTAEVAETAP